MREADNSRHSDLSRNTDHPPSTQELLLACEMPAWASLSQEHHLAARIQPHWTRARHPGSCYGATQNWSYFPAFF
jgi:hypothetical protein